VGDNRQQITDNTLLFSRFLQVLYVNFLFKKYKGKVSSMLYLWKVQLFQIGNYQNSDFSSSVSSTTDNR